jgi:1-phosphofructokinase family hexose kinase
VRRHGTAILTTLSNNPEGAGGLLVAGPNLTIDRTSSLPELRPGEVLRVQDVAVTPGGKGVNVCRAARSLTLRATLVAFTPGHTGRAAAALLADEGIDLIAVPCGGEVRSTAILMEPSGRATVLNEPGPSLAEGDWHAYKRRVVEQLHGVRALVCSGSVPPATPDGAYAELEALARESGCVGAVDSSGAVLREAVAAGAGVVAPNLAEAEALLGYSQGREAVEAAPDAGDRAMAGARKLVESGAQAAAVTAAGAGAAFAAGGGEVGWVAAPSVSVRNPIGSGDAFTAALASRLAAGADLHAAVVWAVAVGSASVESPVAGGLDVARACALATHVAGAAAP